MQKIILCIWQRYFIPQKVSCTQTACYKPTLLHDRAINLLYCTLFPLPPYAVNFSMPRVKNIKNPPFNPLEKRGHYYNVLNDLSPPGPNGSGKSSIVSALCLCLGGELGRSGKIRQNELRKSAKLRSWLHVERGQSWALEVFFNFFNNKWFFGIFYKVNDLFLNQAYLKSPLPVKLTW